MSAACTAVGLLGRCAPLLFEAEADVQNSNAEITSKQSVVEKLLEIMNNKKLPSKVRERAAKSLGLICVGEIFPYTRQVLEGLLNTAKDVSFYHRVFSSGLEGVLTTFVNKHF